ncbi:hypothetical protein [Acerihabitans sp.]|uniref:hypothetical protein n=1 Tax=Acerihabitans sp. TaxID=2811394 RepID=UPI002ED92F12
MFVIKPYQTHYPLALMRGMPTALFYLLRSLFIAKKGCKKWASSHGVKTIRAAPRRTIVVPWPHHYPTRRPWRAKTVRVLSGRGRTRRHIPIHHVVNRTA